MKHAGTQFLTERFIGMGMQSAEVKTTQIFVRHATKLV